MEGTEKGGKGRMIPWWWALIAWVIGEAMGIAVMAILFASWDKVKIKKAADAGTSTAAHMGRKDYFL